MISPRRAEKRRLESNVRKLLLAIMAEVLLVVGVAALHVACIRNTRGQIKSLERQIAAVQPTVDKIKYYEAGLGELKPKLDTLNTAKADTLRWRRVLDDLSMSLPQKTWLTRLATLASPDQTKQEMVVSLNGISADQKMVGETMLRIQDKVSDFSQLDLHFTQKSAMSTVNAVEFELAAVIKLVDDTDKKEVEKS
jgi:Tfp pilus assembly protein PilN